MESETARQQGTSPVEHERSFRAYLQSRRNIYSRSGSATWRFVIRALGEDAIQGARAWTGLKHHLAGDSAPELAAARAVWRSYERWRDGRDLARVRHERRLC